MSPSYVASLPLEGDLRVADELRRDDQPKLGSFGADGLTIVCHCSDRSAAATTFSALVAGVDCERRLELTESKDTPDSRFSSREGLLVLSPELVCEAIREIHEFRLRAGGIFWVSIAAGGGFLLNRFPALISDAFCLSSFCFSLFSRSFCSLSDFFWSFFLCFSPWSDQLGEWHISWGLGFSTSFEVLTRNGFAMGCEVGAALSDPFTPSDRSGEVCERGIGYGRRGEWGAATGDLGDPVGEVEACVIEPVK